MNDYTIKSIDSIENLEEFFKITRALSLNLNKKIEYVPTPYFNILERVYNVNEIELKFITKRCRLHVFNYLGSKCLLHALIEDEKLYICTSQYSHEDIKYKITFEVTQSENQDYIDALIEVDDYLSDEILIQQISQLHTS